MSTLQNLVAFEKFLIETTGKGFPDHLNIYDGARLMSEIYAVVDKHLALPVEASEMTTLDALWEAQFAEYDLNSLMEHRDTLLYDDGGSPEDPLIVWLCNAIDRREFELLNREPE